MALGTVVGSAVLSVVTGCDVGLMPDEPATGGIEPPSRDAPIHAYLPSPDGRVLTVYVNGGLGDRIAWMGVAALSAAEVRVEGHVTNSLPSGPRPAIGYTMSWQLRLEQPLGTRVVRTASGAAIRRLSKPPFDSAYPTAAPTRIQS
ncbi:hypothetical protein VV02_05995 [Luteipulveratus mongoliensis]|uniref:Lipoprotein n=1 Tax=Luteipulveratus mongoliensis TaxID=571913 RepID=A0A0K1JFZ3_9MICO|nr:hypothetical protein VV02_05995 [Luteipulveratus mongoliensis]